MNGTMLRHALAQSMLISVFYQIVRLAYRHSLDITKNLNSLEV